MATGHLPASKCHGVFSLSLSSFFLFFLLLVSGVKDLPAKKKKKERKEKEKKREKDGWVRPWLERGKSWASSGPACKQHRKLMFVSSLPGAGT